VLRVRTLGAATWDVLKQRRAELQPPSPTELSSVFLRFSDIIAFSTASDYQLHKDTKSSRWLSKLALFSWKREEGRQEPLMVAPLVSKQQYSNHSYSSNGRTSTPRKVVPVEYVLYWLYW
jgi:hypothetical protein